MRTSVSDFAAQLAEDLRASVQPCMSSDADGVPCVKPAGPGSGTCRRGHSNSGPICRSCATGGVLCGDCLREGYPYEKVTLTTEVAA